MSREHRWESLQDSLIQGQLPPSSVVNLRVKLEDDTRAQLFHPGCAATAHHNDSVALVHACGLYLEPGDAVLSLGNLCGPIHLLTNFTLGRTKVKATV